MYLTINSFLLHRPFVLRLFAESLLPEAICLKIVRNEEKTVFKYTNFLAYLKNNQYIQP
jgi:hypothetical protein